MLLRYSILALALAAFLTGVFFIFQGLLQQRELIEKESRISVWFLAQTEIEFLRLMEALKNNELSPGRINAAEANERFEIFWSRLPLLLEGPQSSGLREIDGFVPAIRSMIEVLTSVEVDMSNLETATPRTREEIFGKLDQIREPVHDIVRRALLYETNEVNSGRAKHRDLYLQLLVLFAIALLGGLILFALLFSQILKTRKAVVAAATSAAAAISARQELELAINSISEGFIIYDQNDRVALFNQRYIELHPLQADVFEIGVSFRELQLAAIRNGGVKIAPDKVEAWLESCEAQRQAPESNFESRLSTGKWLKISERRTSDGRIVGVHTDITELKEREALLNEKSALLRTTLEHMKQGIAVFDADYSLVLFNDQFKEINRYPEALVYPQRRYQDLAEFSALRGDFGTGDKEALVLSQVGAISALLHGGTGSLRQQRRLPDGRVVETIVTALPTGGFVKTYDDITERVQSEAERSRLTEKYHAAQKAQALGTLAGGIAHDFNNIIGSILGNCSLLMIDTPKDDPGFARLRQIVESGTRARDLVRQVLAYSRNTESEKKPIEIHRLVQDSLATVRPLLPENVAIRVERMDECLISGDTTQLHQILLNLCLNAAHAVGNKPGTIFVSIEHQEIRGSERAEIAAGTSLGLWTEAPVRGQAGSLAPGRYARVTIRDTGTGIDAATMPRIFEPFFTTKEVGEGTGLGLAAVQGIVRNHNGVIAIESVPGMGTSFAVYFPIIDGIASPSAEISTDLAAIGGRERILLIDDDRVLLSVTKEVLSRLGYAVDAYAEPLVALEALRAQPKAWDVVITDRSMPKMPGEVLAIEMKKIRPDLPILMLSGFISAEDYGALDAHGINAVVSKPMLPEEISAAVQALLAGKMSTASEFRAGGTSAG